MSKKKKKQTPHSEAPLPFYISQTSGRLLMAVHQANHDASAGHSCLHPQELRQAQPALNELIAFEDQALEQRVPSAINARMLSQLAIILCRGCELTYGRFPVVSQEHLKEAKKVVATHGSELLSHPANGLATYVSVVTRDWLDKDWFAPAVDPQQIRHKALTMWLAFEFAACGMTELADEKQRPSTAPEDGPIADSAPTASSIGDRDALRQSNLRPRIELKPSIPAKLTSASPGFQFCEWVFLHGDNELTPEWELGQQGYTLGGEIIRLPGYDNMPFLDIFPLVDVLTGRRTEKSYAHVYHLVMGYVVHLPFQAFAELVGSHPVQITDKGMKIQRSQTKV